MSRTSLIIFAQSLHIMPFVQPYTLIRNAHILCIELKFYN